MSGAPLTEVSYRAAVVEEEEKRGQFARVLKDARKRAGVTQDQLAEQTGVSARTILRWERGDITKPRGDELVAVADALDIPREDVLRAVGWLLAPPRIDVAKLAKLPDIQLPKLEPPDMPMPDTSAARATARQLAAMQAQLNDMFEQLRQAVGQVEDGDTEAIDETDEDTGNSEDAGRHSA